jgi:hypothetical protein
MLLVRLQVQLRDEIAPLEVASTASGLHEILVIVEDIELQL